MPHRRPGLPHPAPRGGGQLPVHGGTRALRALFGGQLRPRTGLRQRAARLSTASATWRSGTWCSCSFQRGEGDKKGSFPILGELANKSIDTGLGLDRLAAILQDVQNVCTTGLLLPTMTAVQKRTGREYPGHFRHLADDGIRAREILAGAARAVGGGAEGKGTVATAGGRHPELDQALAVVAQEPPACSATVRRTIVWLTQIRPGELRSARRIPMTFTPAEQAASPSASPRTSTEVPPRCGDG